MNHELVLKNAQKLLDVLDKTVYPRSVEFLQLFLSDGNLPDEEVAFTLMECDPLAPPHPAVAEYLTAYLSEATENDGEGRALLALGSLFYNGRFAEQNYEKAFGYYERAAERGNVQAIENLGYCHYYGRFVPVDYEKAFFCFLKAAAFGATPSLYKLGDCYRYGNFVEKDEKAAFAFYNRAYKNCFDEEDNVSPVVGDVALRLGDCFRLGIGTEKDAEQALSYYQKAEHSFYYRLTEEGERDVLPRYEKAVNGLTALREEAFAAVKNKTTC